ncbi:aminotransferase class V-fold PLP-dependent enzyme [Paucibacter sp. R3-3]|uniref:Aminotransferase class V-fold PLP-dependent enzyme n=1 Tax=Roseateles agri TaxID=3098619 RepID=A0ABU5DIH6_9BURK|nr:aminotransferase class V-fold PLP-dependent enzyme [Paucibacter sp. R3-3]MDY0746107.1 aminotransferase class V-fold PLP-dependent enzyme [Paucibacter sp. R3-3]
MPALRPDVDPDGLLEYSVVYTDRSLNHMSKRFQQVMRDISATLKEVYKAKAVAIVPGSGSTGMESVARQFVQGQKVLIVRNGWFSYRWTQIIEAGRMSTDISVHKARRAKPGAQEPFAAAPIEEVVEAIGREKPQVVFCPHVETASGMLLPDDYLKAMAEAVRAVGGLLVLDCVASGAAWVDMQTIGIDVLVSAPQKGWSGTPCAGLIMLGERALEKLESTTSDSFSLDLKKWLSIMQTYEAGAHAYHATLPTDGLLFLRDAMNEMREFGFDKGREAQFELGRRVRALLAERGIASVAAPGFEAPGVVVSYTAKDDWHKGSAFAAQGLQIAAGVPLACDEGPDYKSFRLGLFGLDKLKDVDGAVARLKQALDRLG